MDMNLGKLQEMVRDRDAWRAAVHHCSHEIKRRLLPGRKVMTNLDSILKSRDIILPTKVRLVKANMKVKSESEVVQSCLTLSDPMDCSLPGSSVHGISQARILEWVAISFSRGSSQPTPTPQFKSINSSMLSFLHSPTLASIHDHWENP